MAKPQNPPRDHHYVPQLLLRRFTNSAGTLQVYDLAKGEIYPGSPRSAGFIRDLYSRMDEEGNLDHESGEKLITKGVDTPGGNAIRRLMAKEDLHSLGPAWNDFLFFVAAQLCRTPKHLNYLADMVRPSMQNMFESLASPGSEEHSNFAEGLRERGCSEEDTQEILRIIATGGAKVKPTKDFLLSLAFPLIPQTLMELRQMGWKIARLAPGDPDLVLGDHPAMLIVPPGELVGLRHPEAEVTLPLSPRVAAVGAWRGGTAYVDFEPGQAKRINEETMRRADRFLFASSRSEALLAQGKELHGTGPKVHLQKVETPEGTYYLHRIR